MNYFANKVALITGAGRGVGREIALALASLGTAVAANDINPLNLDDTVSHIMQAGGIARPYVFDIAKRMPIEGMLAQVLADFGRVDILVNHAAVHPDASVLDMDEWEFHRTLDVNLGGPFFCMQQVGRVMREQGAGTIVNLISGARTLHTQGGHAAQTASFSGLVGLTQAAAPELFAYHIRLNAVCYGSPKMDWLSAADLDPAVLQAWQKQHPGTGLGDNSQVVATVLYLCSPEAASLSGQIIAA